MNVDNFDQVLVFCKVFQHKSKRISRSFKDHPLVNHVYKALYDEDSGELRVFLPSETKDTFGIRFDSMEGGEKEYSYIFELYSDKNCMDMDEDSLKLLTSKEMEEWESGTTPKLPLLPSIYEIEKEEEITAMTLSEMINSEDMFSPYVESLLDSIKAYNEEILQGVIYSIEDTVESLSEGLKIPLNRRQVIDELQAKLESQKNNEKPYSDTEMVMLFFRLYYLNNKGN